MKVRYFASALSRVVFFVACFSIASIASAVSTSTGGNTLIYGTAVDGGVNYGWTIDGVFDAITTAKDPILGTTTLYVTKSQGSNLLQQIERRTAFEFVVPPALLQPGVTITKATLYLPPAPYGSTTFASTNNLIVYGYSGDGQITLSDFTNTATPIWSIANSAPAFSADVTSFVIANVNSVSYFGFLLAVDTWGTSYELDAGASLTIQYDAPAPPPVNQPPTVSISSPSNNAQFAKGATITFQGTASDPENAGVSTITWSSNISGTIGTGSTVSTSSLPVGTHTITAKATDSSGLVGQTAINISVVDNTTYCDAKGLSSSYEWITTVNIGNWYYNSGNNSGYGNFTGTAAPSLPIGANGITLTPQFSSGSYNEFWAVWVDLNHDLLFSSNELLFSGSGTGSLSGTITIPTTTLTGLTRVRVIMSYGNPVGACGTFSYGEVEDYTINVVAAPSPTPAPTPTPTPTPSSYCASKASTASYEWINQIVLAGVVKSTGPNGGYANLTATPSIPLVRGANTMNLSPGFSSAIYTEFWRVWIDFNQDNTFADSEIVYGGSSQNTLGAAITVPTTAKSGPTRMRVSMKYGALPTACEAFTYGEVEDYTVSIP